MKNVVRCGWCLGSEQYINYHDKEWGKQVFDDQVLFEFLLLESAQAGLSWITILQKRDNYRKSFHHFNVQKVAQMSDNELDQLMLNSGIIRNRLKIYAARSNAQAFINIQNEYGSFYNYLYDFLPDRKAIVNYYDTLNQVPTKTAVSDAIAKSLKKKGFKFFGSVICYAYMQAVGMVNDHLNTCEFKY